MKMPEAVETAARDFCARVMDVDNTLSSPMAVADLRRPRAIRQYAWCGKAGAYLILTGEHVLYVGRALKGNGLGGRIAEQLRSKGGAAAAALSQADASIVVFPLDDDHAWLAPSLELFLQWKLRTEHLLSNKRA